MMGHIPKMLSKLSEAALRKGLLHLSKAPLPYRKLNYTVAGHARNTLYEADDWISAQLLSSGYLVRREACLARPFGLDITKPKRHTYAPPPPEAPFFHVYNLYAEKTGCRQPDEIIVLLAHKDSQSWTACPGAYDNAVGTIALIEIARVLAPYESRRSIRLLFTNEEHTPWSSVAAAQNSRRRNQNLTAIFTVDSIGGKSDDDVRAGRKTNVTRYTMPEGKRLADLMAQVNETYRIGLVQRSYKSERPGDDDGSFVKAGYHCAVANVGSIPYADAEYHLDGDVPERVDILNVGMAAQATLAAVLTLDLAP